jgi:hypothetical protein
MEVTISFLYPHGSSLSYAHPQQLDILSIPSPEVLTKAYPRTQKG